MPGCVKPNQQCHTNVPARFTSHCAQIASFFLDPLVFREVSRQMLGDRIRLVSSGAYPLRLTSMFTTGLVAPIPAVVALGAAE